MWERKWFSRRIALFSGAAVSFCFCTRTDALTNQWSGCTTRQHHWLYPSVNKIIEILGKKKKKKKGKQKLFKEWNYLVRFYLLCSLRRIPKLSAIRTLRVVVHCKRILNNSCWQSYLLLRVAKSHYFITNLIKPNRLFKPQFEEPLINEFLAFHFFFLISVNFSGTYLLQKVKKRYSE